MKKEKRIILNWMPPAMINLPSPAMSVLKRYLVSCNFNVEVCYWNLILFDLQSSFLPIKSIMDEEFVGLILFLNYVAVNKKDTHTYNKIRTIVKGYKPEYICSGDDFFDNHLHEHANKTNKIIEDTIKNLNFSDALYIGMSVSLHQWVCSSIIGAKIKELCPSVPIVIGGLGTKESAIAFLKNFNQFDMAIWGEGENSLALLSNELMIENPQLHNIPNLVYRKNEEIVASKTSNKNFIDLASIYIRPDFTDYFYYLKNNLSVSICPSLPIEASRGCHWKRCHFCYLNMGYRYRIKPVDVIIDELEAMIRKYDIYHFNFLDNDIIGNDLNSFNSLLDSLIILKDRYPDFQILIAEIITKGLNSTIIKKMSLAGFIHVQIGYESACDSLLKKIEKKNSFSSNILFIKFALLYKIHIGGVNIIRNLIEETSDDIIECIENLHFLRFFLKKFSFEHKKTELAISFSSRYYKKVKNNIGYWKKSAPFSYILPIDFLKDDDNELKIFERVKGDYNILWNSFFKVEEYYLNNIFEYEIIRKNSSEIIYKEYHKGQTINILEFFVNSMDWFVLLECNNSVISFDDLYVRSQKKFDLNITETEFKEILNILKVEKLIYITPDYSEIVSVINTDLVK
jgi:radical SAM domain protein